MLLRWDEHSALIQVGVAARQLLVSNGMDTTNIIYIFTVNGIFSWCFRTFPLLVLLLHMRCHPAVSTTLLKADPISNLLYTHPGLMIAIADHTLWDLINGHINGQTRPGVCTRKDGTVWLTITYGDCGGSGWNGTI